MNHSLTTQLLGLLAGLVADLDKVDHYFAPNAFLRMQGDDVVVGIAGENPQELLLTKDKAYCLGFDRTVSAKGLCLCPRALSRKAKVEPLLGDEVIVLMVSRKGAMEFTPALWVWNRSSVELMKAVEEQRLVRILDNDDRVCWIGFAEKMPAVREGQYAEFREPGSKTWLPKPADSPRTREFVPPGFMSLASRGFGRRALSRMFERAGMPETV